MKATSTTSSFKAESYFFKMILCSTPASGRLTTGLIEAALHCKAGWLPRNAEQYNRKTLAGDEQGLAQNNFMTRTRRRSVVSKSPDSDSEYYYCLVTSKLLNEESRKRPAVFYCSVGNVVVTTSS